MFIPCFEKNGTAYFEFQYCKKEWNIKKLLKKGFSFWEEDSVLVHIDDEKEFFQNYGNYLNSPNTPKGTQEFAYHGVNYYAKDQAVVILERIKKDKPDEYDILVAWLEKAVTEYNGFYLLGI